MKLWKRPKTPLDGAASVGSLASLVTLFVVSFCRSYHQKTLKFLRLQKKFSSWSENLKICKHHCFSLSYLNILICIMMPWFGRAGSTAFACYRFVAPSPGNLWQCQICEIRSCDRLCIELFLFRGRWLYIHTQQTTRKDATRPSDVCICILEVGVT